MGFRDSAVIVVETSRTVVRASLGLAELLKPPSVEFPARVGYKGSTEATTTTTTTNGTSHSVPSTSSTTLPQRSFPSASVNDYLVGPALDEALAADPNLPVSWPFADGDVSDWTQAEAIWKHALFKGLGLRRLQMESPALLSVPLGLSRDSHERACQIFFERFNAAGFTVLERPVAQIFATTSPTGVVIDIGDEITDVTPIYDGVPAMNARSAVKLGMTDCENYLANVLKSNQSIGTAGFAGDSPEERATRVELVRQLRRDGQIKVPSTGEAAQVEDEGVTDIAAIVMAGKEKAVVENVTKKKATAKATAAEQARAKEIEALDLLTVQFKEHSLTLGKERHRFHEPLFDPTLLKSVPGYEEQETPTSMQDTVANSLQRTEVNHRQYIWQGLFVTGDATKTIHGLSIALQSRIQHHLISDQVQTDVQARFARTLSMPDYYAEYRGTGDSYAAFLGSSITAKLAFHETIGKAFVSKGDYTSTGPHAVIVNAPCLI